MTHTSKRDGLVERLIAMADDMDTVDSDTLREAAAEIRGRQWRAVNWWRVVDEKGAVWCETSILHEAEGQMRPGFTLYQMERSHFDRWILPPAPVAGDGGVG